MNKEQALNLLHKNMQSKNLRRHCYAVGFALAGIYSYLKEKNWKEDSPKNQEVWETLGILHDSDYELTKDDWTKHKITLLTWLKESGMSETDPIYLAVMSHNNKITSLGEPQTQMEWALECCDELTGFIVAVALIKPEKKLSAVDVAGVKKKFKQKAFAAAVEREQIAQCEEKLGISLDDFISVVLSSMQKNAEELGL